MNSWIKHVFLKIRLISFRLVASTGSHIIVWHLVVSLLWMVTTLWPIIKIYMQNISLLEPHCWALFFIRIRDFILLVPTLPTIHLSITRGSLSEYMQLTKDPWTHFNVSATPRQPETTSQWHCDDPPVMSWQNPSEPHRLSSHLLKLSRGRSEVTSRL